MKPRKAGARTESLVRRELEKSEAALDALLTEAQRRCLDSTSNKTAYDWMNSDEVAQAEKWKALIAELRLELYGDPKERVQIKRRLRMAKVSFNEMASIRTLRDLMLDHDISFNDELQ